MLPVLWALQILVVWSEPDPYALEPFGDAVTYRAAGERLNAGHDLYRLGPGDRPVHDVEYVAPLLSPPAIAVLWRPLAALGELGWMTWIVGMWAGLLATIAYLVSRLGLAAAVAVAALSWPLGEMLATANVSALIPGLMLVAWLHRDQPRWGAVIGALAAVKLAPGVMVGWWAGAHRIRGVGFVMAGAVIIGALGVMGAGIEAHLDYLKVAAAARPSGLSIAGLVGLPWLTYAMIVAATVLSTITERWPRASFLLGYGGLLAATPAVYVGTLSLLVGLMVPFVDVPPGQSSR